MEQIIKTKYGIARINGNGYYQISSNEKGYRHELLHRLIAREHFGSWIDEPLEDGDRIEIHHINGNRLDNSIDNLQPMPGKEHGRLHNTGSDNNMYGKNHTEEDMVKMSDLKSTTGFFRVTKPKMKNYKKGFAWCYQYYEDGKRYSIYATSCEKLEQKVRDKGLLWKKL